MKHTQKIDRPYNTKTQAWIVSLPNHPERVAIKVPALNQILRVFKHNLNERSVVSIHHRCVKVDSTTSRVVRYTPNAVNSSNLEVIGKL